MSPFHVFTLAFFGLLLLMGITKSMFMVVVISSAWARTRRLSSCDLIVLCQAVSNISIQCFTATQQFARLLWSELFNQLHFQTGLFVVFPFLILLNFGITALLCFVFCVKIVNYANPLFMRLKEKISDMVPRLLLGTLLIAFSFSVPVLWEITETPIKNSSTEGLIVGTLRSYSKSYKITMQILGCSLPLVSILISAVMIVTSLYKHTQRMEQNSTAFSRPNMAAHKAAANTILSLLVLYICFYVALMLALCDESGYTENSIFYVFAYTFMIYPCIHSLILILGNSNLQSAATKMLCCLCS